jgi:tripartite-type tricarboxylate transporter receptor subunit TctC
MHRSRLRFIVGLLLTAVTPLTWSQTASAQDYPSKPITLIVPFAPGGSSDIIARLIGAKLSESLKQSVVIESKPGGAGVIAMQAAARAPADGYTLILGHIGTMAVNPAMFEKLPYDAVKDFVPVSLAAIVPTVLVVHPSLPANNLKEFLEIARTKPGTINLGSAGNGSAGHLASEYLKQETKLDKDSIVHVPYRGTGPMLTDLLAGQTQATVTGAIPVLPHVKAGKLKVIAVGTTKRLDVMPDVATVAESGFPGFETSQWYGILAPANTPAAIVSKLATEIAAALKAPDVVAKLKADGSEPVGSTPEEFTAFIAKEAARWGVVVKTAGIKAD